LVRQVEKGLGSRKYRKTHRDGIKIFLLILLVTSIQTQSNSKCQHQIKISQKREREKFAITAIDKWQYVYVQHSLRQPFI
jgi:hypothetical protein